MQDKNEQHDVDDAADVYEELLCVVDGGNDFVIDQSAASAILAMLEDPKYLEKVKKAHEERYG
jgi:hypothetical protein